MPAIGSSVAVETRRCGPGLMALYHLFSHPVERAYRAGLCSKAAVFLLLTTALTYIPPLLVAFRSHGEPARPWRATRLGSARPAGPGRQS